MTHEEIKKRLSAFHDGELPRAETLLIEKHLGGCAECALELARLRAFDELLAPRVQWEDDRAFTAEVLERIREPRPPAAAGERSPFRGWWEVPVLALASFALYVLYVETALLPAESDYLAAALAAQNKPQSLSDLLLGHNRTDDEVILAMVLAGGEK